MIWRLKGSGELYIDVSEILGPWFDFDAIGSIRESVRVCKQDQQRLAHGSSDNRRYSLTRRLFRGVDAISRAKTRNGAGGGCAVEKDGTLAKGQRCACSTEYHAECLELPS